MSQFNQSANQSINSVCSISVRQLIAVIEQRQVVTNKGRLDANALDTCVQALASLDKADVTNLSFANDEYHAKWLPKSKAGVIITSIKHADAAPDTAVLIEVNSPYLAYASCSQLFDTDNPVTTFAWLSDSDMTADMDNDTPQPPSIIHPTAYVDTSAKLGNGVWVGAHCFVDKDCQIGDGSYLQAGVVMEMGSVLGKNCRIMANVVIHHHCQLGDDVHIHAGAVIGSAGFGYAPYQHKEKSQSPQHRWQAIAQVGQVQIGHRVRIGANTCIDRGAIDNTVIADDVIIDNLVQIAHNVHIGQATAIAANTAIAGSTHIGQRCIIAGAVGISGHLSITDDVIISAMTMVTKSIDKPGRYSSGIPVMPPAEWRRAVVGFRQSGRKQQVNTNKNQTHDMINKIKKPEGTST